jgi:hypothetical protein
MAPRRRSPTPWSGSDLGITSLAVLSTGEVIPNPRHLEIAQREPGRLQRQAARRIGGPGRSPRCDGVAPRPVSPACRPLSRTPAATACTNSPPAWCAPTERS